MATTAQAIGQITIVDLNDAKQVQAYLVNSGADSQMYNPDTNVYAPSYTTAPITITPKVYVTGNADDQIGNCSNMVWKINGTATTTSSGTYPYSSATGVLTIKKNLVDVNALQLEFNCDYTDPETQATTKIAAFKTITKSASAGALFQAVIETPNGYVFDSSKSTSNLTAVCKAYRGATQDTSNSVFVWEKLNIANKTWSTVTATTTNNVSTLTVKPSDVLNFQSYRCRVTDDSNSATAMITFEDKTDPFTVEVVSTTGDKIVNGVGSTTIMARIYRNGEKIEDENTATPKFTYTWTKYDKNGNKSNWNGTTSPTKSGNKQTVSNLDIDTKATFICEIAEKTS